MVIISKTGMRSFGFLLLTFVPLISFSQYLETFSTPNKGILGGPCTTNDPTTCVSFNFVGVNWTIGGDLSGLDNLQPNEGVQTLGGVLTTPGGDVDEEVCWVSPLLDISTAGMDIDFSVDISYTGFDATDYLDVEYSIDGGAFIVAQPNIVGSSGHTISGATPGINGSHSGIGITGGLSGNTLQIRVCADFNSSAETFTIDNVAVPDANVSLVLPIDLISFSAYQDNKQAELYWITANEINNEYIEIERSKDGENFTQIGVVNGNGTSQDIQHYRFSDSFPFTGINYYRLKQVDNNGKSEYSKVIRLNFKEANQIDAKLYPNPCEKGLVKVSFASQKATMINIIVFSTVGSQLMDQTQTVIKGNNNLNLDLSELGIGSFIIKLETEGEVTYQRLLIEK